MVAKHDKQAPTGEAAGILPMDPLALLKRDRALAEKAWNRLSLAEQVRQVLQAPMKQRQELCQLSHDMRPLVQALPPEEVWLTIQELGGADALALFHHTSVDQVQFCLDVECWAKDRWQPAPTLEWLRLIAAGGIPKILEFFQSIDAQLLGLLMKRWVSVYLKDKEEDAADAVAWPRPEPPVTIDGVYYFQVADEQIDQWLRPMLELYGKSDHAGYTQLLKVVIGLAEEEQEESAFEHRSRRLAEQGFPEWDEAIGVYRRLQADQFETLPRRTTAPRQNEVASDTLCFALKPLGDMDLLLGQALQAIDDPLLRDACGVELARLANRIVVADGRVISVPAVRSALKKAISFINLGLEQLSGGDVERAKATLGAQWLTNLFQIGFSLVMQLGEWAKLWLAEHPTVSDVDDPTTDAAIALERIRAASWQWPKFYIGPQTPDGILHRDFQTLQDLQAVKNALQ